MKRKAGIILVVLFLAALFIFLYKGYYKEIIGNSNADNNTFINLLFLSFF